jgi:hypothetical protein
LAIAACRCRAVGRAGRTARRTAATARCCRAVVTLAIGLHGVLQELVDEIGDRLLQAVDGVVHVGRLLRRTAAEAGDQAVGEVGRIETRTTLTGAERLVERILARLQSLLADVAELLTHLLQHLTGDALHELADHLTDHRADRTTEHATDDAADRAQETATTTATNTHDPLLASS